MDDGQADFGQANQIYNSMLSRVGFCEGPAVAYKGGKLWTEK